MDWCAFGVWAAAFCHLVLLSAGCAKLFRPVRFAHHVKNHAPAVLLFFAAIATVEAQKTNAPPRLNAPLRQLPQNGATVTQDEIARGYRLAGTLFDADYPHEMPADAVIVGNWHKRGAYKDWLRLDLGEWSFPLGSDRAEFSSFSVFTDAKIRATPRDTSHEICAVPQPMLAMQGASVFWVGEGERDSRILEWRNFFAAADTNNAVTARMQFFPSGDFTTSSNAAVCVYERINPDDWDGDGLANGIDANPCSGDGDFHGTGAAWCNAALGHVLTAATNGVGETVTAWIDANDENCYYWLDFAVTGRFDAAAVSIVCDGPSNLGDMTVIARNGESARVPLLIGADYDIESDMPFSLIAPCDANAEIATNNPARIHVSYPLTWSMEKISVPGGAAGASYRVVSAPVDVSAAITNIIGGCCSIATNCSGIAWSCQSGCACCGDEHWLDLTAAWKGYSRTCSLCRRCPCATEDEDENGASNNLAFSAEAIVFENAYTNAPGDVVARRSTTAALGGRIVGGRYGGSLSVTLSDGGGLVATSGALPSNQSIAAEETFMFSVEYEAVAESQSEGDITATATFTENMTGRTLTDTASVTAVRVEVVADASFPTNKVRHVFGPQETAIFNVLPAPNSIAWTVGGTNAVGAAYNYCAPNEPSNYVATVTVSAVDFIIPLEVIAPVKLEAISCSAPSENDWLSRTGDYPHPGDVAVGLCTELRLMPDYVSFGHVFVQEGECSASNITGIFLPYAYAIDPHGVAAGAWTEIAISDHNNYAGRDMAAVNFDRLAVDWDTGEFRYDVTNYWYVKERGAIVGTMKPFIVEPQIYNFHPSGDMSVEKYKCIATRGTNDITIITRRP